MMSNVLELPWRENVGCIRFVDTNKYYWIAPFELVSDVKSCLTSPTFLVEGMKWRIEKMKTWLYLWNEDSNSLYEACIAKFSIECLYYRRNAGKTEFVKGFYHSKIDLDYGSGEEFLESNKTLVNGAAVQETGGCVKILWEFVKKNLNSSHERPLSSKATHETENSSHIKEEKESKEVKVKGLERLAQNLKKVLDVGQNSDVTLKAEDREFRVHRIILGARSPVFASMFEHEMTEKTTGVVNIPDCTAESFEVFLLYLYTGAAETMSSDNVSNLYYAADKYRVDDLKEECVQFMKDNMSVENVCDVLALSLRHGERGLLKEATNFFRENVKEIIKTVQWQRYLQENNTHANELLVKALDA